MLPTATFRLTVIQLISTRNKDIPALAQGQCPDAAGKTYS
jgi:hypothetical protein